MDSSELIFKLSKEKQWIDSFSLQIILSIYEEPMGYFFKMTIKWLECIFFERYPSRMAFLASVDTLINKIKLLIEKKSKLFY